MKLPPFYTARYVEINSAGLSLLWLASGLAIVLLTVVYGWCGSYSFVERDTPDVDVKMWQDYAVDGSWWPSNDTLHAGAGGPRADSYCGSLNYTSVSARGATWGSDGIKCITPADTAATLFYPTPNEIKVATSVAYGSNPQYDSDEVYVYEGIEHSTIVLAPSFSTKFKAVPHVHGCIAIANDGVTPMRNRYAEIHPGQTYGAGFLQLSVQDVMTAAGTGMNYSGGEGGQPIRLSGLEIAAYIDIRNYHTPFLWPAVTYNPFNFTKASDIACTVKFKVLRDEFTPVQWTLAKEFHPDKFRVAFPQCKEAYSSGTEPEADFKESIADKAFMHISELYQLSQK